MSKSPLLKLIDQVIPKNTSQRTLAESIVGVVGGNGAMYLALQLFTYRNTQPILVSNPAFIETDSDFLPMPPTPTNTK